MTAEFGHDRYQSAILSSRVTLFAWTIFRPHGTHSWNERAFVLSRYPGSDFGKFWYCGMINSLECIEWWHACLRCIFVRHLAKERVRSFWAWCVVDSKNPSTGNFWSPYDRYLIWNYVFDSQPELQLIFSRFRFRSEDLYRVSVQQSFSGLVQLGHKLSTHSFLIGIAETHRGFSCHLLMAACTR